MKKIILASSSPRRIEMMKKNGYDPLIMPANIDETLPFSMSPAASVMYLALKKASFVMNTQEAQSGKYSKILAADTIVLKDNIIIGKPENAEEAFSILSRLRNDCHQVLTGVCIIDLLKNEKICLYDKTDVFFTDISDEELTAYVNTPEPYDKAGGYAIHLTFKKYTDHINGDFNNVIGLPWYKVEKLLK